MVKAWAMWKIFVGLKMRKKEREKIVKIVN
jgi:hypothetical protein